MFVLQSISKRDAEGSLSAVSSLLNEVRSFQICEIISHNDILNAGYEESGRSLYSSRKSC